MENETLMLELLKTIKDDVSEVKEAVKLQNGRVRKLEQWKAWMIGAIALGSFIIPLVVAFVRLH